MHNENNIIIVHSHPFKSPHHHSTTEFKTISILSNIESDGSILSFALPVALFIFIGLLLYKRVDFIIHATFNAINPRSPPIHA